jgi:diguanylate cyclase (GGDEF)-like protein
MRTRRWTLRRRLGVNALVCVVAVVGTGVVGSLALTAALRTSTRIERLAEAQSRHQDIDMAHDAVQAIVARSALAGQRGDLTSLNDQRAALEVQREVVDSAFADVYEILGEEPQLLVAVQVAANDLGEFLALGDRIVNSMGGTAYTQQDWNRFGAAGERLTVSLAQVTDRFRDEIRDAHDRGDTARREAMGVLAATALGAVATIVAAAVLLRRSLTRTVDRMAAVATAVADGDLSRRNDDATEDELGTLARRFDAVAASLDTMVARLTADAARSSFSHDLASVLDTVDGEQDLAAVAERAMQHAAPAKVELLLADSSRAHLERAAVHPAHGGPGCGVVSPFDCAAVRRGDSIVFRSSDALDACPKLSARCVEAETAVCAPVSFMGRAVGVLHASRPDDEPFSPDEVDRLGTMATALGTRVGTIRAFRTSQLRASTDGLTGLSNRRTLEERLNRMIAEGRPFALAVADLDRFKQLNDAYGHETGDRALRVFAEVLRGSLRSVDLVARWGGEEFTIAFPDVSASEAAAACDRVRESLLVASSSGTAPAFTASFGVVDASVADDLRGVLRCADEALYAAKSSGRNRVVIGPVGVIGSLEQVSH